MIAVKIAREDKNIIIAHIQNYFEEERSETIGDLAAEQFLDFMLKELGPHIYNKAIVDARRLISERFSQIDEDLYTLERPTGSR